MNLSARDGCPGKRFKDRCAVLRRGLIGSTLKSHDFLKRRSSASSSSTKPASRLMNLVLDHDILPNGAAIIRPADGRTTIERLCGRSVEFGTERRPKAPICSSSSESIAVACLRMAAFSTATPVGAPDER